MPQPCSICVHPDRKKIDRALVAGEPNRRIASQCDVSEIALRRHKVSHLPATLMQAQAADETAAALDVMAELRRCFERVNLLFDACDRWLRDADDPSHYDIGPRASELLVTYATVDAATGKTSMRKEPLSRLLARVDGLGITAISVETKQADPRELVLKTADRLRTQTELLAKLLGDLDERPQINVLTAPEWGAVRAALLEALRPYPEARTAAATRLVALESSA